LRTIRGQKRKIYFLLLRLGQLGRLVLRLLGLSKEVVVPEGRLGGTSTSKGNAKDDLLVPGESDPDELGGLNSLVRARLTCGELAASGGLEGGTESDRRLDQGSDHFAFVECIRVGRGVPVSCCCLVVVVVDAVVVGLMSHQGLSFYTKVSQQKDSLAHSFMP
jgi:hypothetical protein